jgi:adenylate cyclase
MYGTRIMLSETTAAIVGDRFVLRKLDLLRVKGKKRPMAVYELIAEGAPLPAVADLVARYERALSAYQAGQFADAAGLLDALIRDYPSDGPTATLSGRVRHLIAEPPGDGWDGVYVAKDK